MELLELDYCSGMCLPGCQSRNQDHLVVAMGVAAQYSSTPYHLLHLPETGCPEKTAPVAKYEAFNSAALTS